MALIAVAADKGAPGVTTTAVSLAAVWPRPVLLAECDPAGGDIVYRLPAAEGGHLDPRHGLLSLAVAGRRGLQAQPLWEHTQKLRGGLDVLVGVSNADQGAALDPLWGTVGATLSALPQADVIADCGRIGADGPPLDLLAHAAVIVLITRATVGEVIRLRDRVSAVQAAVRKRGRSAARCAVVVVADHKRFSAALEEVGQVLAGSDRSATVIGGLAYEPKSADLLRGEWGGKLDKSLLIRTARDVAGHLAALLPVSVWTAAQASPARPGEDASSAPPGRGPTDYADPGSSPGYLGDQAVWPVDKDLTQPPEQSQPAAPALQDEEAQTDHVAAETPQEQGTRERGSRGRHASADDVPSPSAGER